MEGPESRALRLPSRRTALQASGSGDRLALRESWALARVHHSWEGDLVQGVWTAHPTVGQQVGRPNSGNA